MRVELYLNNDLPITLNWWQCKQTCNDIEMSFSEPMSVVPERGEFVRILEANRILFEGYVEQASKDYIKIRHYFKLIAYRTKQDIK